MSPRSVRMNIFSSALVFPSSHQTPSHFALCCPFRNGEHDAAATHEQSSHTNTQAQRAVVEMGARRSPEAGRGSTQGASGAGLGGRGYEDEGSRVTNLTNCPFISTQTWFPSEGIVFRLRRPYWRFLSRCCDKTAHFEVASSFHANLKRQSSIAVRSVLMFRLQKHGNEKITFSKSVSSAFILSVWANLKTWFLHDACVCGRAKGRE